MNQAGKQKTHKNKHKKIKWPWAITDSLEQQERQLDAIDPAKHPDSKFTASQFNKQKKRIEREKGRWLLKVDHLRKNCYCWGCVHDRDVQVKLAGGSKKKKKKDKQGKRHIILPGRFPFYYIPRLISWECWLQKQREVRDATIAPEDKNFEYYGGTPQYVKYLELLDKQNKRDKNFPPHDRDTAELLSLLSYTKSKFTDLAIDLNRTTVSIRTLITRLYNDGWPVRWDNKSGEAWIDIGGMEKVNEFCDKYFDENPYSDLTYELDKLDNGPERNLGVTNFTHVIHTRSGYIKSNKISDEN